MTFTARRRPSLRVFFSARTSQPSWTPYGNAVTCLTHHIEWGLTMCFLGDDSCAPQYLELGHYFPYLCRLLIIAGEDPLGFPRAIEFGRRFRER